MRSASDPHLPLPRPARPRHQLPGPASLPFCFFAGGPTMCPFAVTTPFPITSITLSANLTVTSAGRGWPPSFQNLQSRKVHLPRTLDQHKKGLPVAWTYFGRVGKSLCPFPAAARISARCTRRFVRSRYPCMRAFSFGCRSSFQPERQSRVEDCPTWWNWGGGGYMPCGYGAPWYPPPEYGGHHPP